LVFQSIEDFKMLIVSKKEISLKPNLSSIIKHIKKPQTDIPRIAKDPVAIAQIETAVQSIQTTHDLYLHDARSLFFFKA